MSPTGPIVVKVGGTTLEDPGIAPALFEAVARAAGTLHERGSGVVLVHGGGRAVDQHLDRLGMETQRREGIRITPPEQIEEIAGVLAGRINKHVVGSLARAGARGVGLYLGDAGVVRCARSRRYAFDPGRVGEVLAPEGEDGGLLALLVRDGYVPVVSSIGRDEQDGGFLNVNADDAAAGVARAVGARALVLITDVPGILDAGKRRIERITPEEIQRLIAEGVVTGGMIVKARAAAQIARESGVPVVIMSGADPAALAGLARAELAGTRIVASHPSAGA